MIKIFNVPRKRPLSLYALQATSRMKPDDRPSTSTLREVRAFYLDALQMLR